MKWWWHTLLVLVCVEGTTLYKSRTPTVREHDDMQRLLHTHQVWSQVLILTLVMCCIPLFLGLFRHKL